MRHYKIAVFSLIWLSLCLVLPSPAMAEDGIGKIIAVRGQVTAEADDGASRVLTIASPVLLGDTLRTGKSGRVQVLFQDSTIVSLGPASEMQVADYAWDGETGRMKTVVNEGVFRVLGGSITKTSPKEFTTETPAATIGIRGSMYAGRVSDGRLQVVFQGGTGIYVRTPVNMIEIDTVGFGTRVDGRGVPAAQPYRLPPTELEDLDPLAGGTEPAAPEHSGSPAPAEPAAATASESADAPAEESPTAEDPAPVSSVAPEEEVLAPLAEDGAAPSTTSVGSDMLQVDSLLPSVVETLTSLADQAVLDASTDTLASDTAATSTDGGTTTTSPPPPAPTYQAVVSGQYMAAQDDLDSFNNIADLVWTGSFGGQTIDGQLTGRANTNHGTVLLDPMPVSFYDPSLPYTGYSKTPNQARILDLLGSSTSFTSAEIASDNTGEFAIFALDDYFNSPLYSIRELGFAGTPTLSLPTTGIVEYHGPLLGFLDSVSTTEFESFAYDFRMIANWHSGKVLGIIQTPGISPADPPDAPGFFFGDISGTGIANVKFIGMDIVALDASPGFMPLTIDGTIGFGQFYGNQSQGIGFLASGNTYDVLSQTLSENWRLIGGGYRIAGPITPTAGGTVTWQGFALGIAEDMNTPDLNRRIFMNQSASNFSLTVNRDSGVIAGVLNATDQAGSATALSGLIIGGSYGSAYISEQLIAAGLGGVSPIVGGTLKAQGNYLISEDPAEPIAHYATWGTWELAFEEPGGPPTPYHVHVPGSMWVAGERTPATAVQGLIDTNFSATYLGRAEGVMLPSVGPYFALTNGATALNIDFGAQTFNGNLNFTEVNLPLSGTLDSAGFSGLVPSALPGQSSVQGAFFGPSAASVGGSFDAGMSGGERYLGVFGGDR